MMLPLPQLKRWRLERFWTQEELAARSGVAVATIHRVESNQPARLKTIRRLAEALGVEPHQLTGRDADSGEHEAA
jgi:transcriptional regulator with XRE-family HTH domain